MNSFHEPLGYFGKFIAEYEQGPQAYSPQIMRMISRKLAQCGPLVLDLHCGAGLTTRALTLPNRQLVGVSPDPIQIDCARSHASQGITYVCGSAQALPFAPHTFDAITLFGTFRWLSRLPKALKQIRRALKPQGYFVVVDKSDESPLRKETQEILQCFADLPLPRPSPRYNPSELLGQKRWNTEVLLHASTEEFTLEELLHLIRSMAVWEAVHPECREVAVEKLAEHFSRKLENDIYRRRIITSAVIAW